MCFAFDMASTHVRILCGAQFYVCVQHFAMRSSTASSNANIVICVGNMYR